MFVSDNELIIYFYDKTAENSCRIFEQTEKQRQLKCVPSIYY